jgi:microcompartment protein CcmK/EutM
VLIGKVLGPVWGSNKEDTLTGSKFMLVCELNKELKETEKCIVAVDNLGAGKGDRVLVTLGSSALQTDYTKFKPVDAVIVAILDGIDI